MSLDTGGLRARRINRSAIASLLSLAVLLVCSLAHAQVHPSGTGSASGPAPPLPTGTARVTGRIVEADGSPATAGLEVTLYALGPDGSPGIGTTRSDATGQFVFERLSNAEGVLYLVGVRESEVPFGQRVVFEPGSQEASVEIALRAVTRDTGGVVVRQSTLRFDWVGGALLVTESRTLWNAGEQVVLVAEDERAGLEAPFRATLPPGARDFKDAQSSFGGGMVQRGDQIEFWGPIYPGEQSIHYQYSLDAPVATEGEETASFTLPLRFATGSGSIVVLAGAQAPPPRASALKAAQADPTLIEGRPYLRYEAAALPPGGELLVSLDLPRRSHDANALSVERADFWVELDDAAMQVTAELQLDVAGSEVLVAGPESPLLELPLPAGAELLGLAPEAARLGLREMPNGGLALLGPVPVGASSLRYRYRQSVTGQAGRLAFAMDRPIDLLNVLVADNGVLIESDRLHRRRPFRSGTRIYMHREAYQIAPGEEVEVRVELTRSQGWPTSLSWLAGIALILGGSAFVLQPLRSGRPQPGREGETGAPPATPVTVEEREHIYELIRDIELDYETGKLSDADFQSAREELRAEAVELLRRERSGEQEPAPQTGAAPDSPAASTSDSGPVVTGRFCPSCGGRTDPGWQFCSHCGGKLHPRAASTATDPASAPSGASPEIDGSGH